MLQPLYDNTHIDRAEARRLNNLLRDILVGQTLDELEGLFQSDEEQRKRCPVNCRECLIAQEVGIPHA